MAPEETLILIGMAGAAAAAAAAALGQSGRRPQPIRVRADDRGRRGPETDAERAPSRTASRTDA